MPIIEINLKQEKNEMIKHLNIDDYVLLETSNVSFDYRIGNMVFFYLELSFIQRNINFLPAWKRRIEIFGEIPNKNLIFVIDQDMISIKDCEEITLIGNFCIDHEICLFNVNNQKKAAYMLTDFTNKVQLSDFELFNVSNEDEKRKWFLEIMLEDEENINDDLLFGTEVSIKEIIANSFEDKNKD